MKSKLYTVLTAVFLLSVPTIVFSQAPDLGTTADFVVFSADGAVSNTGLTHLTGKVGTNNGSNTGFGNVNGGMHEADGVTAQAMEDLLVAYDQLDDATPDFFPDASIGGGETLSSGTYAISGSSTLNEELFLDAQNNSDAVFIFQIEGSFSTGANSKVTLLNGAQACNVFWKVEGLVEMAAGTTMRGTVIANNSAINMNTLDTLEGRVLTTSGAITLDGVLAYTPTGCGSPELTGPTAPVLGEAGCYGLFSSDGPVENSGTTNIVGDVGCNIGLTTGFNSSLVTGTIHSSPDNSTANAAADLLVAYDYLIGQPADIELLYPAQFGNDLVLTPHTYLLNGATTFIDTVYLNARGVADAVFIIKIYGALETGVNSNVVLQNGAQAKNVYWLVNGAVDIFDNSVFNGTIVSEGAINLYTDVKLNGRALCEVGALSTTAIQGTGDIVLGNCNFTSSIKNLESNTSVSIYPNPMGNSTTMDFENLDEFNQVELHLYNVLGEKIITKNITSNSTTFDTSKLSPGVYHFSVTGNGKLIHSGKLISQ